MATNITFTDDTGAVTIDNDKPAPGDRLTGWTPLVRTVGPAGGNPVGLGNGITYGWEHRLDHGARFSIEHIPQAKLRDVQRLIHWLMRGEYTDGGGEGTIRLDTGDQHHNRYTCRIWPGSEPQLEQMDRGLIEYRLTLELLNTEQDFMICGYDEVVS